MPNNLKTYLLAHHGQKVKQPHLSSCHDAKCSWEKVEAKDGDKERGGGGDPGLGKDGFGLIKFLKTLFGLIDTN